MAEKKKKKHTNVGDSPTEREQRNFDEGKTPKVQDYNSLVSERKNETNYYSLMERNAQERKNRQGNLYNKSIASRLYPTMSEEGKRPAKKKVKR